MEEVELKAHKAEFIRTKGLGPSYLVERPVMFDFEGPDHGRQSRRLSIDS